MDAQLLEAQIEIFKENIAEGLADPSLAKLDLEEFIEAVALTPREKKQASQYLRELNKL